MRAISSLWVEGDLSNVEILAIRSFLANGHEYKLYSYTPPTNAPKGTQLVDAREIMPQDSVFAYQCGPGRGSVSAFSNVFRYQLLLDRGGIWVDADVVCLRPFDFPEEYVFGQERLRGGSFLVASCVLGLPAGSSFARHCLGVCCRANLEKLQWGEIGPKLVTRTVLDLGLKDFVKPPAAFCPSDWWRVGQEVVGRAGADVDLEGSYAVHLWNEMWRRQGIDKNKNHHPLSLYAILRAKYIL